MNRNIYLIGFMGSGKSTIGKVLADVLGYEWVDLDHYIEKQQKIAVKEIFEAYGEPYFRQLEVNCLKEIADQRNLVVSTGGGIITTLENVKLLKNEKTFYLKWHFDTLFSRVSQDQNRPLVKNYNQLLALYLTREKLYEDTSFRVIEGEGKSVTYIAKEIMSVMEGKMKIAVINGPNLNFLGIREPQIYGNSSLENLENDLITYGKQENIEVSCFQSNYEGAIIDFLQKCYHEGIEGIIINPGAYTHYSYAIADALKSISKPVVEVHISHIHDREEFRRHSVTAPACIGVIEGFGFDSYFIALDALTKKLKNH